MAQTLQDVGDFPRTAVLTPRVHRVLGLNPSTFTGPGTNTYLVGMDGPEPLLIDTGSGVPEWAELLAGHLAAQGAPAPRRVLMTHAHPDHLGGAADAAARFPEASFHKHPWPERDGAAGVPLQNLAPDAVVEGPGYTLRAVHSPGHAPDHLCFYLEEERALFTGDVILGVGTTVIPNEGGDLGAYLDTLRRLEALAPARIYPGHGPMIEDAPARIREYLEHRLRREAQILEVLSDGPHTVQGIVERVYAGYPTNLHAAAGQSVTQHLRKLEGEGRTDRDTDEPPRWRRTD